MQVQEEEKDEVKGEARKGTDTFLAALEELPIHRPLLERVVQEPHSLKCWNDLCARNIPCAHFGQALGHSDSALGVFHLDPELKIPRSEAVQAAQNVRVAEGPGVKLVSQLFCWRAHNGAQSKRRHPVAIGIH